MVSSDFFPRSPKSYYVVAKFVDINLCMQVGNKVFIDFLTFSQFSPKIYQLKLI